jgi:hypothetical protein
MNVNLDSRHALSDSAHSIDPKYDTPAETQTPSTSLFDIGPLVGSPLTSEEPNSSPTTENSCAAILLWFIQFISLILINSSEVFGSKAPPLPIVAVEVETLSSSPELLSQVSRSMGLSIRSSRSSQHPHPKVQTSE